MNLDATKFLEDLTGKHAKAYTETVQDMLVAMALGQKVALSAARKRLEDVITETMGAAEVLGASIVLREAAKVIESAPSLFASTPTQTILPRVTFIEALEDMVTRTPTTIRNAAERTAQNIAKLYGEGRVVAFARSAEQAVTERVGALISDAIRTGGEELGVGRLIKTTVEEIRDKTGAWSEGYARMAFRTNVNTAVTAGRFRQAQDPAIAAVMPAMQFLTADDVDVRHNHGAADDLIFKTNNPVWNRIAPPLGYNCRCTVRHVSVPELRRMGRITAEGDVREDRLPPGAFPDNGFRHGGRPDLFINGVAR
jgi:SPP1 gp7 family putative phage head morphogenesis protein